MMSGDSHQRAKTPAQRKRDERDRRRAGLDLIKLQLPRELVREGLLETGELSDWNDNNPSEIEAGLERLLLRLFRNVTRDLFAYSDLLNSDDENNRDSVDAGTTRTAKK